MKLLRLFFTLGFILIFLCCNKQKQQQFIYIGHCYKWGSEQGNQVDPRIEKLDLSNYQQIWLGGDVCGRTSQQNSTLEYLDKLFAISSSNTHWSLGNHDINKGNKQLIQQKTKRPSYYTTDHEAISILVLDTNFGHPQLPSADSLTICMELNQQFQLLKNLTDTITQAKYLVVLHHHALLSPKLANGDKQLTDAFHYVLPQLPFSCTPAGTFEDLAYPLLKNVQEKDIQVVLIGGDFGQRAKRFEYQNPDGIWFLGSGINNSMDKKYKPEYVTCLNPDSILIFNYDVQLKHLEWEFRPLGGDWEQ